jgi:hypothetical protein
MVVKGRSDLNDPLQKCLFRLGRLQPDFLPGFVRLEEMAAIKLFDSAPKRLLFRRRRA